MELKPYQTKVIKDLESYLGYVQQYKLTDVAFKRFWEDQVGTYNPITGEGMRPYQNNVPNAAHVCIKVPTAGGKTFIACNALKTIFNAFDASHAKAVVWLVPWSNLLEQTVRNLINPDHPYRQKLNALFNHRVAVYEKKDLLQGSNFSPSVVSEQLSIFVMSFGSIRATRKEDRKIYDQNGQLSSFVQTYSDPSLVLANTDESALINVIRNLNPIVVVDESHNAETDLSVEMLKALNPCFILDLTATPKDNSNIVSMVPAIELKKHSMVKLPVIVYNHKDKHDVISSALHLQRKLEASALAEEKITGRYIRPIVLFQAQSATNEDNTTFEKLKAELLKLGIKEEQIKIKTANKNELTGIDLSSRDCQVRYIITINALKEGWDCPFAYILASLADKSSAVDVEQILGRVLRQPYVIRHADILLNVSYVLTSSAKFNDTLQNIVKSLLNSGFSDKDYRQKDDMPEAVKEQITIPPLSSFLFPEQMPASEEITADKINFVPDGTDAPQVTTVITTITDLAEQQNRELEEQINKQPEIIDDNYFAEMGTKVKRYRIREALVDQVKSISIPRFYIDVARNNLFETGSGLVPLDDTILLTGFALEKCDKNIAFDDVSSELYKVDLQETRKNEYSPSFTKIEDRMFKEPLVDYILAKPKESQLKDLADIVISLVGDMYPIPDSSIKRYVESVFNDFTQEQTADFLARKYSYIDKIKQKIKVLADVYAEEQFNKYIKVGKIKVQQVWKFPESISPGNLGPSIGQSLYEREGSMNGFEERVILELSSLSNIDFWHRNIERRGFAINGFKSNHYPDFILYTKTGNVILLETKGDHLDGTDSAAKCRLGNQWQQLSGSGFSYFMVFDAKPITDSYTITQAKEMIRML